MEAEAKWGHSFDLQLIRVANLRLRFECRCAAVRYLSSQAGSSCTYGRPARSAERVECMFLSIALNATKERNKRIFSALLD